MAPCQRTNVLEEQFTVAIVKVARKTLKLKRARSLPALLSAVTLAVIKKDKEMADKVKRQPQRLAPSRRGREVRH